MNLVTGALKRPITIIVIFLSLVIFSIISLFSIPIDIFPKLNLPTIYVIESYGGMSAQQMEGFFATSLQDQFLYVSGVKTIESKNIQGLTFLKITFYEGTDMAEASAQVALQVNRAMKFFPPGALPPQVIRFDASSLPVGELVLSSKTKDLNEIYDLATTRVRPMFATVRGLSAPPPLGANARTVIINVDPDKMRAYNVTPDEMVKALSHYNIMAPSGNVRIANNMYITTMNSLEKQVDEFSRIPVKSDNDKVIFMGDVAKISDGMDVTVDYALINGKRSIYIPVVKAPDASTLTLVNDLKSKLPEIQSLLPDDVRVDYEFDQSVFVINAVKSLASEGILGALLTGLMVLLFLRDLRSSLIVIITIPISILVSTLLLNFFGQTINLMTLSGLALAVGVLVDMATVTIENIHQHLEAGKNKKQAILDACAEISFPLLLILLCVLAVFAPAFIMTGVPKAMFLPLSLAIGFAMIAAYLAAQMVVPVLSNWILNENKYTHYHHTSLHAHAGEALNDLEIKEVFEHAKQEEKHPESNSFFQRLKQRLISFLNKSMPNKKLITLGYLSIALISAALGFTFIGKDLLPKTNNGQFQMRIKLPEGTRLERTEEATKKILALIDSTVSNHVDASSAYVGLVPSSYGTSNLYVFNSGTHEAVLQIHMPDDYKMNMDELKEVLRKNIHKVMPEVVINFEPIDLTEKVMSQGANNPIEVRVAGKDIKQITTYADSLLLQLRKITSLRDIQINQPLKMPVIDITIDRLKVAQFGLDVQNISNSVTAATSSSRFVEKNLWLDEKAAYTYQVQVQVPEYTMNSINELKEIPLIAGKSRPNLGDVAEFKTTYAPGEFDRAGPRRFITISANINQQDLGSATALVQKTLAGMGTPPKGVKVEVKGMSALLTETLGGLQKGLLFAVLVILLLLAANYESFKLALTVVSTVPAVIVGSISLLLLTGSTLNLQSYMGMIMSIGVSVANAILIVTNAENLRLNMKDASKASVLSASIRLRPILMTSLAMVVGMIPMALGLGEAGEQTAPLGRAVIGGLVASTFTALLILPVIYSWVQQKTGFESTSLLPEPLNQA